MSYNDGIIINGKHSYRDYDLQINARKIDLPPKNSIKKTIPFMNGAYDFTKLYGAVTWGERQISYTFDIVGNTIEEMDAERTRIVNIYCNMHDVDIYDDTIPDYHFHGSFSSATQNEDAEKTELTIVFLCYPFMISNTATAYTSSRFLWTKAGVEVEQPVSLCVNTSQSCRVTLKRNQQEITQAVDAGDYRLALTLQSGDTIQLDKSNEFVTPFQNVSHEDNGITFTYDEANKTITANGTATDNAYFYIRGSSELFKPPVGRHRMEGCPSGGSNSTYRLQVFVNNTDTGAVYHYDTGNGVDFEVKQGTQYLSVVVAIGKGTTVNNLVFKPTLVGETTIYWNNEVL